MSNGRNTRDSSYYHNSSTRRLRVDDMAAIVLRNSVGPAGNVPSGLMSQGHSGRMLVVGAGIALLVIWGALYLVFRDWRARYRERALYGATQVLPAVDRLRSIMPATVDPVVWRKAVDQTGAMLITVTGSNLLDIRDMDNLRAELDQHGARATDRPETAVQELADIWDEVADRGEFLFNDSRSVSGIRHPRPKLLPPRARKTLATLPGPVR